jgi:hypothetical protein
VTNDDAYFCEKCGYRFASDPKANVQDRRHGKNVWWIVLLVIVVGLWYSAKHSAPEEQTSLPASNIAAESTSPKPVESAPSGESEDLSKRAMRQQYANNLGTQLKNQGYDIVVTELGDQLILAADFFEDTSTRVQFLNMLRKSNSSLCNLGFSRLGISGKGLLSSTYTYSLNCPETRAERKTRSAADVAEKEKCVRTLQDTVDNTPALRGVTLSQANGEMIVTSNTGVIETGPSLQQWKQLFVEGLIIDLCAYEFTAVRLKDNAESDGLRIPIRCF